MKAPASAVALIGVSVAAATFLGSDRGAAQATPEVRAIAPPRNPLPDEKDSAGITRFSFIVYGDTRGRRDGTELQHEHSLVVDAQLATIKARAASDQPVRFVLQTGDAVVNGRDANQWNVSFVRLINRLTEDGGVPYFLAPGNHDVTSSPNLADSGRQEGLRNYLAAIAGLIPPEGAPRRLSGYPTYAFGYGNLFVIALDSNLAADDTQYRWVEAQLAGLDRARFRHVLAFFHHPPFSSGPHAVPALEPQTLALRERYLPLFRRHRVAMTFSGHEHFFEHWVERYVDASGAAQRMDHVVTGGGGAPIYTYRGEPQTAEYLKANAADKVSLEHLVKPGLSAGDNPYHFVIVTVDGERLSLEVVGVDWGRDWAPYRSRRATLRD